MLPAWTGGMQDHGQYSSLMPYCRDSKTWSCKMLPRATRMGVCKKIRGHQSSAEYLFRMPCGDSNITSFSRSSHLTQVNTMVCTTLFADVNDSHQPYEEAMAEITAYLKLRFSHLNFALTNRIGGGSTLARTWRC